MRARRWPDVGRSHLIAAPGLVEARATVCVSRGGVAQPGLSGTARRDAGAMEEYAREPWYGDGYRPRGCSGDPAPSCGRRAGEAQAPQRHGPGSGDA